MKYHFSIQCICIVLLILSSLTYMVKSQTPVIKRQENRYICEDSIRGPITEPVEWLRNNIVFDGNRIYNINGSTVNIIMEFEEPRHEAEWTCRVKSTGNTSIPSFRYIVPQLDAPVQRMFIVNSTGLVHLPYSYLIGPLSKRDIGFQITWNTYLNEGRMTRVVNYTNQNRSVNTDINVIGFNRSDFSIVFNASSITQRSFNMSCSVNYQGTPLESMIRIRVMETPPINVTCGDSSYVFEDIRLNVSCFKIDWVSEEPCLNITCLDSQHANISIIADHDDPQDINDLIGIFLRHGVDIMPPTDTTPMDLIATEAPYATEESYATDEAPYVDPRRWETIVVGVVLSVIISVIFISLLVIALIKFTRNSRQIVPASPDSTHQAPQVIVVVPSDDQNGGVAPHQRGQGGMASIISPTECSKRTGIETQAGIRTNHHTIVTMDIVPMVTIQPPAPWQHKPRPHNLPCNFTSTIMSNNINDATPPRLPTPEGLKAPPPNSGTPLVSLLLESSWTQDI